MKKLLLLLLAVSMILTLAACKPSNNQDASTTSDSKDDTETLPEIETGDPNSRENIQNDLPDLNFQGASLKIGYTLDAFDNLYGSTGLEADTDLVAHDVFERNLYVEELLGCDLDFIPYGETLASWDTVNEKIYNQIMVGGSSCNDVFMCTEHQLTSSRIYNLFVDCNQLEYINLEKPYWWTNMMKECSLDGTTMPFLMGDISMLNYLKSSVMYYNKTIYANYFPDQEEFALYQKVLDGEWTLDVLMEMVKNVYDDRNMNETRDVGDVFGMVIGEGSAVWGGEYVHFLLGCDLSLYKREYNEKAGMKIPVIDMNNDRVRNSVEKIYNLMQQKNVFLDTRVDLDTNARSFAAGLMLFFPGRFSAAQDGSFSNMDDDYGVLTMPKYDATQKNYITYVADSCAATALPINKSSETYRMAGAVLEAMACYNYKITSVTLLEKLLSTQYASDSMTGKVVDLVVKSAMKNFIAENRVVTDYIIYTLAGSVPENTFVRMYGEKVDSANEGLQRYIIALYE